MLPPLIKNSGHFSNSINYMVKTLTLIVVTFLTLGCNVQSKSICDKHDIPKKLDLEKYSGSATSSGIQRLVQNDTVYELANELAIYKEILQKKGDIVRKDLIYDNAKKILFIEHVYYSGCRIGISRYYDEGKKVGELNNDSFFDLSVNDIVKILERRLGAELTYINQDRWNITRSHNPRLKSSKYIAVVYVDQYKRQYRYIEIDGTSGEILKDTIAFHEE